MCRSQSEFETMECEGAAEAALDFPRGPSMVPEAPQAKMLAHRAAHVMSPYHPSTRNLVCFACA